VKFLSGTVGNFIWYAVLFFVFFSALSTYVVGGVIGAAIAGAVAFGVVYISATEEAGENNADETGENKGA